MKRQAPPNPIVARILADREARRRILAEAKAAGQAMTRQAITDWKKLPDGVPAKRVRIVARVLNLPMHVIRPDLFPP